MKNNEELSKELNGIQDAAKEVLEFIDKRFTKNQKLILKEAVHIFNIKAILIYSDWMEYRTIREELQGYEK